MILFRADGNSNVGLGHIMRCLALADAFYALQKKCLFILAEDSNAEGIILERGFETIRLHTGYLQMDDEIEELSSLLSGEVSLFILDTYFASDYYRAKVKELLPSGAGLICFDDMQKEAFASDGVINYNLYADRAVYAGLYEEAGRALPKLYLGGRFAPFRKKMEQIPGNLLIDKGQGDKKHVLLSCGGADPENVTIRILEALRVKQKEKNFGPFVFHIPIGAVNKRAKEAKSLAAEIPNVICYGHIPFFREFLSQMDLAVSAAGSTLYELCMEGIPSVSYVLADNQLKIARKFDEEGLALFGGDCRENPSFGQDILSLLQKVSERKDLDLWKEKMKKTLDGHGAEHLAEELLKDYRGF